MDTAILFPSEAEILPASCGPIQSAVPTQQELCGRAAEEGLSGKIKGIHL
jgi:hypothetical protein